jgi:hypothetical protein
MVEMSERAREAQRRYMREYRKRNREKLRKQQEEF